MQQEVRTDLTDTMRGEKKGNEGLEAAVRCDGKRSRSFGWAQTTPADRRTLKLLEAENYYYYQNTKVKQDCDALRETFFQDFYRQDTLYFRECQHLGKWTPFLLLVQQRHFNYTEGGNAKKETFREQTAGGFMTSSKLKVFFPPTGALISESVKYSFQSGWQRRGVVSTPGSRKFN